MIALEIHICAQRRSYVARFATDAQAVAFIEAVHEIETEPLDLTEAPLLIALLYPECEHGLSQSNCYGPQHYYYDEEEQGRGYHNS